MMRSRKTTDVALTLTYSRCFYQIGLCSSHPMVEPRPDGLHFPKVQRASRDIHIPHSPDMLGTNVLSKCT
jgi:hypothetical protein